MAVGDFDYAPVGIYDDEDELLKNGGYAPAVPASAPPVAAAAPPASPYPAVGSTEDLEARASAPRVSLYPAAAPAAGSLDDLEARAAEPRMPPVVSATAAQPRPTWNDYKPPDVHGWGKVGRTLGEMFTGIPQRDAAQRQAAYQNATAEYEAPIAEAAKQAETEKNESQAEKDRADAFKATHPQPKEGLTPEETTIHDLMTGENGQPRVNPATGKPYTYLDAYGAVQQAKTASKPEKPDNPEQQFVDEYQKKHPGSTVAQAQHAFKQNENVRDPGTFTPTYDPKSGELTGSWNATTGEVRPAPKNVHGTTAQGVGITSKADAATQKKLEPLQGVLDEIDESREFAATPSATNDYGLLMNFIGVTKPESLAKLRLNQNEVSLATGTRGTLGDINALIERVKNGETLTPEQRQDMLKTMEVVERFTRRRMEQVQGPGNKGDENKGGAAETKTYQGRTYEKQKDGTWKLK